MPQTSVKTEYEKRLIALQQCIHNLQRQDTLEGVGKIAREFLRERFQFDLIWIATYQASARTLSGLQGILPIDNKDQAALHSKHAILPGDLFDQVLLTGQIQEIPSLKQDQRAGEWQGIAQRQKIQGAIILPIRYRHQPLGILLVGTTLWGGHPRSEEMNELKMLTGILGTLLFALADRSSPGVRSSDRSGAVVPQDLVHTLSHILATNLFEERLKLVLEHTHSALQPNQTSLYWFDTQTKTCRLQEIYTGQSTKRIGTKPPPSLEVEIQQIAAFYQTTEQNQVVAIADVQGVAHNHHAPARLMTLTKSRSWLSGPIANGQKLVGVLAVEGSEPRLWSDGDKQLIQLMAQLLSQDLKSNDDSIPLISGGQASLLEMFATLKDVEHEPEQWDKNLKYCLGQIGQQFAARWVGIVRHNPQTQAFDCTAQFHQKKKQPFPEKLSLLSDVDTKLLSRLSAPITISSIEEDLRLLAWRKPLLEIGCQAYLLVRLSKLQGVGEFLILGADLRRTWTEDEAETLSSIAQPLGQAFSRRIQWQQTIIQQQINTVLNEGIWAIQQSRQVEQLFAVTTEAIDRLLGVECLVVLQWSPEHPSATIAGLVNRSKFQVNSSVSIPWQTDAFIQSILEQSQETSEVSLPKVLTLRGTASGLTTSNSGWLSGANCASLVGVPLQIHAEDPPLGIILAMDSHQRHWSPAQCKGLQLLVRELTVHYRSQYLIQHLSQKQDQLQCLNWFKQRHLEHLCRLWTEQLSAASVQDKAVALNGTKQSQSIAELQDALNILEKVLKTDVWDLHLDLEQIPVATLFKRSLARMEAVIKTRQLWIQIHNLTTNVSLYTHSSILELMLVELLLAASYRTKVGDHIDIWCRALQDNWVEISITDNGRLNPKLVSAIQDQTNQPSLGDSILETMPGLHFKVCKLLVERLGGKLELANLEDGRSLSRLILPQV
jgi:GAF domain-containing protein